MARLRPWIVTPHKPIEKLEDNLWLVSGQVPGVPLDRKMAIIRRADGSLLFFHAVPVDDASLAQIRAWGKPEVLVIPHGQHGKDAAPFAQKLELKIYGPKEQEAALRKRWNLAGTIDQLPADPNVRFETIAGSKNGEPVAIVTSGGKLSLLFADAYQDNHDASFLMRLSGFGGGPKVVPVFKLFITRDRAALKAHFERLASLPNIKRLIPCHGLVCSIDGASVLKRVAATL